MKNKKVSSSENSFSDIYNFLQNEIEKGVFPGAVLSIVTGEQILYQQAAGKAQLEPEERSIALETVFDLASLTKVLATTSAIMKLIESGKINLHDSIEKYFPEIGQDKENINIYNLLTHTSGYQATVNLWEKKLNYKEKIEYILDIPLEYGIGETINYSDPNFILLGEVVQRVTGKTLQEYTRENIFLPLKMGNTGFNPLDNLEKVNKKDFAATEYCDRRERMVVGEVHDKNAYYLGGISGHAGLFSDINDLSKFVMMLLNNGIFNGTRIFSSLTVKTMIKNWTSELDKNRALGWELANNLGASGGIFLSKRAFGHTGFTGTSIWIDPEYNLGIILLSNRVHPSRKNRKIISFRPRFHNFVLAKLDCTGIINLR